MKLLCVLGVLWTLTGCMPVLDGDWTIEVQDSSGEYEGEMTLTQNGDEVEGSLSLDVYSGCSDLEADVTGDINRDGDEVELEIEFDSWTCGEDTYTFYDMEVELDIEIDGFQAVELDGDGDWGEADIDFIAEL